MPSEPIRLPPVPVSKTRKRRRAARGHQLQLPVDMGGLDDMIGYAVRRAQVTIFKGTNEMLADLGITCVQFSVIRLVQRNPGINQISLATALGAEGPRMVFIIDQLEQRGIVARLASTLDRRARAIFLTSEGQTLHEELSERVGAVGRRLKRKLRGDDPRLLLRMLRNLARAD